jgi:CarD family transcriptional regulator
MEKIKTGSLFEVAEVFRDLYRLKSTKTLSFGERRMLDTAKNLIVKELSVARNWTEQRVEKELEKAFAA